MTVGIYGIGSQSGRAFFADYLSKDFSCPLVLGSATPDLKSYYKAFGH